MIKKSLHRLVTYHPLLTFFVMLLAAALFGVVSYDLFFFLKGNLALVADYGVQALYEGAFEELVKLFLYGGLSLIFYIIFKSCEHALIDWIVK